MHTGLTKRPALYDLPKRLQSPGKICSMFQFPGLVVVLAILLKYGKNQCMASLFRGWRFQDNNRSWILEKEIYESQHDKTNKMTYVCSEDSYQPGHPTSPIRVSTVRIMWRKLGFLATHWAHNEDSDQSGLMLDAESLLGAQGKVTILSVKNKNRQT